MYYGNYNEQGEYIGFYRKDIHKNIPSPNVKLSKEKWKEALTGDFMVVEL